MKEWIILLLHFSICYGWFHCENSKLAESIIKLAKLITKQEDTQTRNIKNALNGFVPGEHQECTAKKKERMLTKWGLFWGNSNSSANSSTTRTDERTKQRLNKMVHIMDWRQQPEPAIPRQNDRVTSVRWCCPSKTGKNAVKCSRKSASTRESTSSPVNCT